MKDLIFWTDRKQPLAPEEVDQNFRTLSERISALESNKEAAGALASIQIKGNKLIFKGTHGVTFPPVEMPLILWQPKGQWKPECPYVTYDLVQHKTCLYLCNRDHSSEKVFQKDSWSLVFETK